MKDIKKVFDELDVDPEIANRVLSKIETLEDHQLVDDIKALFKQNEEGSEEHEIFINVLLFKLYAGIRGEIKYILDSEDFYNVFLNYLALSILFNILEKIANNSNRAEPTQFSKISNLKENIYSGYIEEFGDSIDYSPYIGPILRW